MGSLIDQSFKISKGGYTRVPRPAECPDRRSRYPWANIKEGDRIEEPFPWSALQRVRMSLREWNFRNQTAITIDSFPNGSPDHSEPHFIVGWSTGDKWSPDHPNRVSQQPHKAPKSSSEYLKDLTAYLGNHGCTRANKLARDLNIHQSTVSRVLNEFPDAVLGTEGWYLKPGKKGPHHRPEKAASDKATEE